jgi:hypothetical protein
MVLFVFATVKHDPARSHRYVEQTYCAGLTISGLECTSPLSDGYWMSYVSLLYDYSWRIGCFVLVQPDERDTSLASVNHVLWCHSGRGGARSAAAAAADKVNSAAPTVATA